MLAGDAERGVASQFANELGALRPGVVVIGGSDVTVRRQLALSEPRIDAGRRRPAALRALAARRLRPRVARSGHTVIALTDGLLSPLAMGADHSFTISAASVSPFDSHVGTLALFDLLVGD